MPGTSPVCTPRSRSVSPRRPHSRVAPHILVVSAGLIFLFLGMPHAAADTRASDALDERAREGVTRITLGAGANYKPEFEGADEYELTPYPVPIVSVRNVYGFNLERFSLTYDLVNKRFDNGMSAIRLGPSIGLARGRDEDDSSFLDGLGDVGTGALAGGFFSLRHGPVQLNVSGGQEIAGGHGGAIVDTRLGIMIPAGRRLRINPGVSVSWASGEYMQSFFGITEEQAARSIYAPYDPDPGFKDVGLNLSVRYLVTENWSLLSFLNYRRLIGPAADSPIVEGPGGSRNQFSALVGVTYGFEL